MSAANDLLKAIEKNQLILHYQPIVNLQHPDAPVVGYEALVRLNHPDRGLLFPSAFLPISSSLKPSDFIWQQPLFDWVFAAALDTVDKMKSDRYIAINVCPLQLTIAEFSGKIEKTLISRKLEGRIQIEIVEDWFAAKDLMLLRQSVASLSEVAPIGMDDLGVGLSSLSRLSSLADIISFVKIDRSFMPSSKSDVAAIAIYQCLVDMAHILKMKVVAEGIEHDWQVALCRTIGVDCAQGFLIGRGTANIH